MTETDLYCWAHSLITATQKRTLRRRQEQTNLH
jgi:hypothetical protein